MKFKYFSILLLLPLISLNLEAGRKNRGSRSDHPTAIAAGDDLQVRPRTFADAVKAGEASINKEASSSTTQSTYAYPNVAALTKKINDLENTRNKAAEEQTKHTEEALKAEKRIPEMQKAVSSRLLEKQSAEQKHKAAKVAVALAKEAYDKAQETERDAQSNVNRAQTAHVEASGAELRASQTALRKKQEAKAARKAKRTAKTERAELTQKAFDAMQAAQKEDKTELAEQFEALCSTELIYPNAGFLFYGGAVKAWGAGDDELSNWASENEDN